MTQQVVEKIIRVDVIASAGAQRNIEMMAQSLKKIDSNAADMKKSMSSSFSGLESIFQRSLGFLSAFGLALGSGAIVRGILDMSSAYEVMNSRLRLVLGSQNAANIAQREIVNIAVATGRDLDGTAKLYEKAARAAEQFGKDQALAGKITEAFSNSIRLSGASTQEAYAAQVQFGQALASGRLQGDEFRSLMENNSVFMYEFAKAAGSSVTELRKMGSEGKLSSEFLFDTMTKKGADGLNLLERLNKMAGEIPLTFRQSAASLGSQVTAIVGELAKMVGGSSDPLGTFGPIIRSLQRLTQEIRNTNEEATALGRTGFFEKIAAFFTNNDVGRLLTPTVFSRNAPTTPDGRIQAEIEKKQKELMQAVERMQTAQQVIEGKQSSGRNVFTVDIERLKNETEAVRNLTSEVERMQTGLRKFRENDINMAGPEPGVNKPKPKGPEEPSKEAKRAAEALKDFIEKMREEAAVQEMLNKQQDMARGTAQDLVRFEKLLTEAKVDKNSKLAQEIRLTIQKTAFDKEQLEVQRQIADSRQKEIDLSDDLLDKAEKQIKRDEAAIQALKNKTRASQEFITQQLQESRTILADKMDALKTFGAGQDDPLVQALEAQLSAMDRAIAKRKELEDAQARSRVSSEEDKLEKKDDKRGDRLVNEINSALKRGIAGSSNPGKALFDNIQATFKAKAIDVIINPVTELAAQVMAQFAQQIGAMLSNSLSEALANSSSDPIGTLAGLKSGGAGALSSLLNIFSWGSFATGIKDVPYDNFPARLHRGERVLTADENRRLEDGRMGKGSTVLNYAPVIQVDARSDAAQVQQIVRSQIDEGNRQLVEELSANGVI